MNLNYITRLLVNGNFFVLRRGSFFLSVCFSLWLWWFEEVVYELIVVFFRRMVRRVSGDFRFWRRFKLLI